MLVKGVTILYLIMPECVFNQSSARFTSKCSHLLKKTPYHVLYITQYMIQNISWWVGQSRAFLITYLKTQQI